MRAATPREGIANVPPSALKDLRIELQSHSRPILSESEIVRPSVQSIETPPVAGRYLSEKPMPPTAIVSAEAQGVMPPPAQVVRPVLWRQNDGSRPGPNAAQLADPESEPTINITIGRVDVRAVYPQPQPQPSRRSVPAPMPLDDYLKQRRGGRK
jgi:hypothetical protein